MRALRIGSRRGIITRLRPIWPFIISSVCFAFKKNALAVSAFVTATSALRNDLITGSPNSGARVVRRCLIATASFVAPESIAFLYAPRSAPYEFQKLTTCGLVKTSSTLLPPITTSNE